MNNFREMIKKRFQNGCPKKFQTFKKYEHIKCHFKARDLEISLI